MSVPTIAIVGRPNVGKSTIFNRLIGEQRAIVSDIPGTTRDRAFGITSLEGQSVAFIDTAGILPPKSTESLAHQIDEQINLAFQAADVLVFVVDAQEGATVADEQIARALRRGQPGTNKTPLIFVANKAEQKDLAEKVTDLRRLGFGEPLLLSATQGRGFTELTDALLAKLPKNVEPPETSDYPKVSILGRPNAGKSTLLNGLLGEQRAIVSDIPGTTRDPVNALVRCGEQTIEIVDTAGIRRRGKIGREIEFWSVIRAIRTLDQADLAILLLDAERGLTDQDQHIAGFIQASQKAALIVVNKWDVRQNSDQKLAMHEWLAMLQKKLAFLDYAPVVFLSALNGQNLDPLREQITTTLSHQPVKLSSHYVDKIVENAKAHHPAIPETLRLQQDALAPNHFSVFGLRRRIHFSIMRYIENNLRDALGWPGWPIVMTATTKNPHLKIKS